MGSGRTDSVASVITPSTPSEPTSSSRSDGPAADGGHHLGLQHPRRRNAAQPEHELVDAAVAGRRLSGRARGHVAADRRVLERLREVPEREAAAGEERLRPRAEHARLEGGGERERVGVDEAVHQAQVERDQRREAVPQRLHSAHHAGAATEGHHRHPLGVAGGEHLLHGVLAGGPHHGVGRARGVAGAEPHEVRIALARRALHARQAVLEHVLLPHGARQAAQHRLGQGGLGQADLVERHVRPLHVADPELRAQELGRRGRQVRLGGVVLAPAPPPHGPTARSRPSSASSSLRRVARRSRKAPRRAQPRGRWRVRSSTLVPPSAGDSVTSVTASDRIALERRLLELLPPLEVPRRIGSHACEVRPHGLAAAAA